MTLVLREPLFTDFCRFAFAQLASGDIDPTYPVLARLYATERLPLEVAYWRTLLYLTWYNLGTAERAWTLYPEPPRDPEALDASALRGLPTGIERRGFRGNDLARGFLRDVLVRASTRHGSVRAWAESYASPGGAAGWDGVRYELGAIRQAGPWAQYKWADLLAHVHGLPIEASDIGMGGGGKNAGPIPGMVRLTGLAWQECAGTVRLQRELLDTARARGVAFSGLDQLETALCDFNSLAKGGYYVGHDVDAQQQHLEKCGAGLWEARAVFPDRYRGELSGWMGVRKALKTAYRDQGVLVNT